MNLCFVCLMSGAKTCEGPCGLCGRYCPGWDGREEETKRDTASNDDIYDD